MVVQHNMSAMNANRMLSGVSSCLLYTSITALNQYLNISKILIMITAVITSSYKITSTTITAADGTNTTANATKNTEGADTYQTVKDTICLLYTSLMGLQEYLTYMTSRQVRNTINSRLMSI